MDETNKISREIIFSMFYEQNKKLFFIQVTILLFHTEAYVNVAITIVIAISSKFYFYETFILSDCNETQLKICFRYSTVLIEFRF